VPVFGAASRRRPSPDRAADRTRGRRSEDHRPPARPPRRLGDASPLGGEPALTPWWEERPLRDDGAPVDLREGARVTRRWQPLPELTENGAL